ncbi:MAG: DUF4105 domain-containing protein [Tannerellaceae bacterium]|jgi:hypothetical protein|nr:DUF4105 domain-containing protein [Tannerellaceae bacterium]
MRRFIFLFMPVFFAFSLPAEISLSDDAQISILTCSPSEIAVFTVYGHTAIRVSDPAVGLDMVFNYGIFDFHKSGFIYRFTKGETDYQLGVTSFGNFVMDYASRGSGITEQTLNLTPEEKHRIWAALADNARPENATYRYNFFFDNCATRQVALIERCIDGRLAYRHEPLHRSFREEINRCMRNKPWLLFGCQLALGSPADREMSVREELFLPLLLEKAFDSAAILSPDGQERPLVSTRKMLLEDAPDPVEPAVFTPLVASLVFLGFFLLLTVVEWRTKRRCPAADCALFALAGLGGLLLFFLAFVSVHPATWPNWSLLWLHPLHLIGAVLPAVKTWKKAAYSYHFINFAALTLTLAGWHFIPQHFHIAFIPLIACLWMRSGWYVLSRYK